ncbi:MAG: hypothetical protein KDH97_04110 [Calditrichaeota bacterium]|nr:hypothetical protein [Calditrichota bacterium]
MNFLIFAPQIRDFLDSVPDGNGHCIATVASKGLHVFCFPDQRHRLYFVEIGEYQSLETFYRPGELRVDTPPFRDHPIALDRAPSLIVVYHWGRGVFFEVNRSTPALSTLQIGLQGKWTLLESKPRLAVSSGGMDPLRELVDGYFHKPASYAAAIAKIEAALSGKDTQSAGRS